MSEPADTYTLARFSSAADAETAQRCLTDAGLESWILPESPEAQIDPWGTVPVHLVCRSDDRILAIVVLERARVI